MKKRVKDLVKGDVIMNAGERLTVGKIASMKLDRFRFEVYRLTKRKTKKSAKRIDLFGHKDDFVQVVVDKAKKKETEDDSGD